MSSGDRNKVRGKGLHCSAADIARMRNGAELPAAGSGSSAVGQTLPMSRTSATRRREADRLAAKVVACALVILALSYLSLCFTGAAGQYYTYSGPYSFYTPVQVGAALLEHAYNAIAVAAHVFEPHSNQWILENVPGYWAITQRAGVVGVTLLCAVLLSVSGMLYQNVFKNLIAGPGMLGVGSGVSLGMMVMVAVYGGAATGMLGMRYALCYGFGAAILVFVIAAGRRLSGAGRPFDTVTMLLVGSILSQLLGFIVSYVTLFVMDEEDYLTFYTLSQMLVVDTSALSWLTLGLACLCSFAPVWFLRFRLNALAFEEQEVRAMGVNMTALRAAALVCGAIMILAAQIHVGMVALVSLVVPFLSRSLFGCEFSRQLAGNVCIGMIVLLVCRDITDCIPFIADGLAIGSVASVVMAPLFAVAMARQMRGWE
ncbi:MAG: iron chelate uptake ABC transporter family permease subunit [Coriobacteriales bacterium]